jgi:hypothetical protein
MPDRPEPTFATIRQILLDDWDPSNAARFEHARREYDAYIEPLLRLIRRGAGEDDVVRFLHDRERESMCFPGLDTRRLVRVARKLIAAVRNAS